MLNVVIFLGSVRSQRIGHRPARFLQQQCAARGWQVNLADPKELDLPLLDKMYKEYPAGEAPASLEKLAGWIKQADGFMVCSAEYNHSIPPALSNMLDHFLEEYLWRPSAIACYSPGAFGGVRAAMQLRAFLAEIGTPSISSILPFPNVGDVFDEQGTTTNERVLQSAARFLDEFAWVAEAYRARRASGTPF